MRLAALALPLALPLSLLAACGGGGEDDAGAGDGPAVTVLSEDDLASILTTAGEVPAGFLEREPTDDEDSTIFAGTCLAEVDGFDEVAGDPAEEARTEFASPDESVMIGSGASSYDSVDQVSQALTGFADQLEGCTAVTTTTDDGVTLDLQVTVDDAVTVAGADEQLTLTLAGTLEAEGQSFPASVTGVATRLGNNLTTVLVNEFGVTGSIAVPELAAAQLERLEALLD